MHQSIINDRLQDFLICLEMAVAAIAHRYFFSISDFTTSPNRHLLIGATTGSGGGVVTGSSGGAGGDVGAGPVPVTPVPIGQAIIQILPGDVLRAAAGHLTDVGKAIDPRRAMAVARARGQSVSGSPNNGATAPTNNNGNIGGSSSSPSAAAPASQSTGAQVLVPSPLHERHHNHQLDDGGDPEAGSISGNHAVVANAVRITTGHADVAVAPAPR